MYYPIHSICKRITLVIDKFGNTYSYIITCLKCVLVLLSFLEGQTAAQCSSYNHIKHLSKLCCKLYLDPAENERYVKGSISLIFSVANLRGSNFCRTLNSGWLHV